MSNPYPVETLDSGYEEDDGTMPENVATLASAVVGRRIISADKQTWTTSYRPGGREYEVTGFVLSLDDGTRVRMLDSSDCCAFTELESFLLHADRVDHAITGVGTTEGYTKWHIYADLGDVLELTVGWSCGNPFYYGYGFDIAVEAIPSD